jgi:hypothetical protein
MPPQWPSGLSQCGRCGAKARVTSRTPNLKGAGLQDDWGPDSHSAVERIVGASRYLHDVSRDSRS